MALRLREMWPSELERLPLTQNANMTDLFEAIPLEDPHVDNIEVDENVIAALPPGTRVIHAAAHGASFWTRTARVDAELSDGTRTKYFLKVASGVVGHGMMEGEFESIKVINQVVPGFAPIPMAWGTFKSSSDLHFFLCSFHEMDDELPEMKIFSARLAQLHMDSMSPTGKYGFHVPTYNGNLFQDVRWTDTWEECFTNGTRKDLELEEEARVLSEELRALSKQLLEKVIPRLLRPLETGGRFIKPCFVHGDLWYGNASNDIETAKPMVFDAAGFYGHNEFEVRTMRVARYQFGRNYLNAYHEHVAISAPQEDFDARISLYALRSYMHESTLYRTNPKFRQELIDEMRKLVEAYPGGYEEYLEKESMAM